MAGSIWALWYHTLAGLRHLWFDSGRGLDIPTAEKLGWGIIGGLVGMMVSLRQVLLHVLPGDKGFGATFLELHFYTWAFVAYLGLIAGLAILLMLPNRDVRSRSLLANTLIILFIVLVFANLASTLLECGIGPCADDPVQYEGWIWLRTRFGF